MLIDPYRATKSTHVTLEMRKAILLMKNQEKVNILLRLAKWLLTKPWRKAQITLFSLKNGKGQVTLRSVIVSLSGPCLIPLGLSIHHTYISIMQVQVTAAFSTLGWKLHKDRDFVLFTIITLIRSGA